MKRIVVILFIMLLAPALAIAGVANPEGFEGYALTTAWNPTVDGEGWTITDEWSAGSYAEIKPGSLAENTSQIMVTNHSVGEAWGVKSSWFANIPDAAVLVTKTSWEFTSKNWFFGSEYQMRMARLNNPFSWENYSWQVGVRVGGYDEVDADPAHDDVSYLRTLSDTGVWVEEIIPGMEGFEPGNGVWYRVEVEEDNVFSKTRARIYDVTTSPGPEDGWTSWLAHSPDLYGLDYSTGGRVDGMTHGVTEYDNFSMTPKPSKVIQHIRKVFVMVDEGKGSEALEYTDNVAGELDNYIEKLRWEARDKLVIRAVDTEEENKKAIAAVAQKQKAIKNGMLQRKILGIVKYRILLKTGELTRGEWKEKTCVVLNADSDNSGEILQYFLWLADKRVTTRDVWDLLKSEVPTNAKGELANWLVNKGAPDEEATYKECEAFFWELLLLVSDSEFAPKILIAFIERLDDITAKGVRQNEMNTTNAVLDTFITLYPDNVLGVTAAKLRLGAFIPGATRDTKTIELVEKYPGTEIARAILLLHIRALSRKGEFENVLASIDANGMLEGINNEKDAAGVFLRLAEKASQMTTVSIPNRYSRGETEKEVTTTSSKKTTSFSICVGMADQLCDTEDNYTAAELIFAALEKKKALPQNLVTGQALHELVDIGYLSVPDIAIPVSNYLRALAQYEMNELKTGDTILESMEQESLPDALKPYVFHLLTKRAIAKGKYSAALNYADFAIEHLPTSPIILSLKMEIKIAKHIAAAETAKTAEEAILHYNKVSELYLAHDNIDQAVETYLLIVEKFPENKGAPAALAESIRILKEVGNQQYS